MFDLLKTIRQLCKGGPVVTFHEEQKKSHHSDELIVKQHQPLTREPSKPMPIRPHSFQATSSVEYERVLANLLHDGNLYDTVRAAKLLKDFINNVKAQSFSPKDFKMNSLQTIKVLNRLVCLRQHFWKDGFEDNQDLIQVWLQILPHLDLSDVDDDEIKHSVFDVWFLYVISLSHEIFHAQTRQIVAEVGGIKNIMAFFNHYFNNYSMLDSEFTPSTFDDLESDTYYDTILPLITWIPFRRYFVEHNAQTGLGSLLGSLKSYLLSHPQNERSVSILADLTSLEKELNDYKLQMPSKATPSELTWLDEDTDTFLFDDFDTQAQKSLSSLESSTSPVAFNLCDEFCDLSSLSASLQIAPTVSLNDRSLANKDHCTLVRPYESIESTDHDSSQKFYRPMKAQKSGFQLMKEHYEHRLPLDQSLDLNLDSVTSPPESPSLLVTASSLLSFSQSALFTTTHELVSDSPEDSEDFFGTMDFFSCR